MTRPRAVVTGAAGGIGDAVCRRLLEEGAEVIAVDRRFAARPAAGAVEQIVCDVADDGERDSLCRRLGKVTWLVNAAGVLSIQSLGTVTTSEWDRVFAVNARAMFFLTQQLGTQMADGAAIVNVGSTAGQTGSTTEAAPYNASKAAVIALTKTFAHAYAARRIRVNCVCPGSVATPMLQEVYEGLARERGQDPSEIEANYARMIPFGRAATPEEVAAVVRFLLSEDAAFITGQAVGVSGGLVM